jgi:beta-galactosidase
LTHDGNFCCDGLVFSDRSFKAGSLEAKAAYQPIRTSYENGVLTVYNRLDFTDLEEFRLHYAIEVDGQVVQAEVLRLQAKPHTNAYVEIPFAPQPCRFGAYLKVQLRKDDRVVAHTQHALPAILDKIVEEPLLALTEDDRNIYAQGEVFRYVFSKHYGIFTSMVVNGREQLADKPVLTAFRAPTDNDRDTRFMWQQLDEWRGENLDKSSVKVYDCHLEGDEIVVTGSLSGISRAPLLRFGQRITVSREGEIRFVLRGTVREDAFWLPRLGFEWVLPQDSASFTYYGNGPQESYRDLCHAGTIGLYQSDAASEYVHYVRPQEHGNHTAVKMLQIGAMEFLAEDTMEINVSRYSTAALLAAEHTDELVADGKIHLRIDYKVSGIGSNSCGPSLEKEYRLAEKEIDFRFTLRPARK